MERGILSPRVDQGHNVALEYSNELFYDNLKKSLSNETKYCSVGRMSMNLIR